MTTPRAGETQAGCAAGWQRDPLPRVFAALDSTTAGLSAAVAAERLRRYGANIIERRTKHALPVQFVLRFRNPLVVLLIVSSVVLGFTGDPTSAAIILLIVVASVTLDFVQEHRAERAVERLQSTVAATARVLRDGATRELPVAQIALGDVVSVGAGDVVPADGRVVDCENLYVNEAALTGESYPVERRARSDGGDDDAMLRMGTSIVNGKATLLVCRTGNATAFGVVAGMLEQAPPEHPFERGMREFGGMILRITLFLVLFVVLVNALFHRPLVESFVFAVALAVGLTPELLPMIASVTLAHGALRLARKHVIVKRLAAIYGLGGIDVLCTDKTGTLTEARIGVASGVDASGEASERVLALACANSVRASGVRSPLDDALVAVADRYPFDGRKLAELPFDFERRRVSVLVETAPGEHRLIVKGAPEQVLVACTSIERGSGAAALDDDARERVRRQFEALGEQGLRALAVAVREVPATQHTLARDDEADLALVGFVTFVDPPRRDAASALAALASAGIAVKILTGDDERVARHVCTTLGLRVERAVCGAQISALGDDALAATASDATLFWRLNPEQKTRVIRALQQRGRVVGFMGDGINDAPALHAADVGVSVHGAAGVAREAADIILTRGRLGVVCAGVLEGRRTYANIMKYLKMATSSNFGNMLSMATATLALPFLPLLPVQILLNNLLYDVSETAIPLDRVDDAELRRPRTWDMHEMRGFMFVFGPLSSVFDLLTFAALILIMHADAALFRTGWFVESLATQVLVIFVIRTRRSALRSRPHPLLAATSLVVAAIAFALPFTRLGTVVAFEPLPWAFVALLLGLVVLYLLLAEYAKRHFYRREHAMTSRHPRRYAKA